MEAPTKIGTKKKGGEDEWFFQSLLGLLLPLPPSFLPLLLFPQNIQAQGRNI